MSGNDGQLKQFVERLERLAQEKKDVSDAEKEVKAEMKGQGYNMKAVAVILKCRANPDAESELEAEVDMYKAELGMA